MAIGFWGKTSLATSTFTIGRAVTNTASPASLTANGSAIGSSTALWLGCHFPVNPSNAGRLKVALTPRQQTALNEQISPHLDAIKAAFKPAAKITVVVRHLDDPDGLKDFVIGDDGLQDAMNAIARRMAGEKKVNQ
jgi:hypothetical protein